MRTCPDTRYWLTRHTLPPVRNGAGQLQVAVLQPKGRVGAAERLILLDSLAITLAIIVPTLGLRLVVPGLEHESATPAYSGRIELVTERSGDGHADVKPERLPSLCAIVAMPQV